MMNRRPSGRGRTSGWAVAVALGRSASIERFAARAVERHVNALVMGNSIAPHNHLRRPPSADLHILPIAR